MKYMTFCEKYNIDYAAYLKNKVNFLVGLIYKMKLYTSWNSRGVFNMGSGHLKVNIKGNFRVYYTVFIYE